MMQANLPDNLEQKVNIIKTFNKQSLDLRSQMVDLVGDNELYQLKRKFSLVIKVNSTKPIKEFINRIYNYKNQIINKDESFFLSNQETIYKKQNIDLVDNLLDKNNSDDSANFVKSLKLDQVWNSLSDKSKNNIWDYFSILILLCDKYIDYKINKRGFYN